MPQVRILPPEIVSKIAAGEVIERPASVIKELLENALDAGASLIEIHLENAGKTLIRVKDNGCGIDEEDLQKIFFRHATSKIKNLDDLFSIQSLGFRGEALYSIAAISDIVLKSKTANQNSGWNIHLRGGERLDLKPVAIGTCGTEIEVKELFFNTPARKKFLKTDSTEIYQILNIVIPYALYHPHARFRLTHNDKTLLDLAPSDHPVSRIAHTLNLNEKNIIKPDSITTEIKNIPVTLQLILGDINIQRTRRDLQFIFVNGRPVQNKSIAYHLNQIYRLIMPDAVFPFFVVSINIPPQELDVNIHPTKREVKIKKERELCSLLRSLCEEALMKLGTVKQVMSSEKLLNDRLETTFQKTHGLNETIDYSRPSETQEESPMGMSRERSYSYPRESQEKQNFFLPTESLQTRSQENIRKKLENARFIGSFINKFLIFEWNHSLLIIDQHAAAERISYEQLLQAMDKGTIETQHLLSPVLIKLSPVEMLSWEEAKEKLENLGISSTQWAQDTIAIHTHPLLIKDIEKAVGHLLSGENIAKCDFDTMARRACRSSVMAGDHLTSEKAEYQRETLLQCLDPFTCPHGRPTVIEMPEEFFDKQFLRSC